MNQELVNSCLVPIAQCQGVDILTIEGLGKEEVLHPIQQSFLECGGAQCGICTPGMVMACFELLQKNPTPSEQQIREGLAGNLCRCTGYMKIFDSVKKAAEVLK
jgi:carbon-monoxide dehydrogenase small subunit